LLGDNKGRLDDHQLANYSQVVQDYLVPIYAAKLGDVCNTQPAVISVHKQNGAVFVRTEFTTRVGAPSTYVDWLVSEQQDGSWRALDIAIDGVSVAQAKQDEFNSVIANRGPDAFIELLYRQAGDALPEPMAVSVAPPDSLTLQTASKSAD
jgi:ABC-type transporter MlaC component